MALRAGELTQVVIDIADRSLELRLGRRLAGETLVEPGGGIVELLARGHFLAVMALGIGRTKCLDQEARHLGRGLCLGRRAIALARGLAGLTLHENAQCDQQRRKHRAYRDAETVAAHEPAREIHGVGCARAHGL